MPHSSRTFVPHSLLISLTVLLSACGDDGPAGPSAGAVRVAVTSTGTPADPDGYTVSVDGGTPQGVAGTGTVTVEDVTGGEHSVLLAGLATNCAAEGENPRSVTVVEGETAEVAFEVTCDPVQGSITVTTTTTGLSLDPDGYLVSVDGGAGQPVATNATFTSAAIEAGEHSVALSDVEPNCTVSGGDNPQTLSVTAGEIAEVAFEVTCESLGNRIAFDSNRDGNYDVYIMNADGTGVTRLTTDPSADGAPAVSPDGTRIIFNSERAGFFQIYMMNADGSDQAPLTNSSGASLGPSWSPDGTRIAFISDREGTREIYVMNADGSNQLPLTDGGSGGDDKRNPVWSPDGTRIAYDANAGAGGDSEIMVIASDGSGSPVNLSNNSATDGTPAWSPDGTKLTFFSAREGPTGDTEIFVMNADGSDQTPLTDNDAFEFESTWSPDGSQIAFVTDVDVNREIYVMNADGSGQTNLTNNEADDELPDWGR